VWKYSGSSWTKVGGDGVNSSWGSGYEIVASLTELGGKLYAGLGYSEGDAEVWKYDPGTNAWAKIGGDGVNSSWTGLHGVLQMVGSGSDLYIGLGTAVGYAEVWKFNGSSWTKVGGDGVNSSWPDATYENVESLVVFNNKVYAGLGYSTGNAEVWEFDPSTTSWTKIGGDNLNLSWGSTYKRVFALSVFNTYIYAALGDSTGDAEVWRFDTGTKTWSKIGGDGLNSSWTSGYEAVRSMTILNSKLYVGLGISTNDAEVWRLDISN
jgi:hypothetical protein